MYAAQVRVDPADNVWVVDQMASMVIKFDPQGRVVMLLGRKAEVGSDSGAPADPERRRRAAHGSVRAPDRRGAGTRPAIFSSAPTAFGNARIREIR